MRVQECGIKKIYTENECSMGKRKERNLEESKSNKGLGSRKEKWECVLEKDQENVTIEINGQQTVNFHIADVTASGFILDHVMVMAPALDTAPHEMNHLNGSTCSSDHYGSPRYGLLEEALEHKLRRSENRRSALAESLKDADNVLQHHRNCLQQQDSEILENKERLEKLLLRQEALASKVSNLQDNKLHRDLMTQNIRDINDKENQRFPMRMPAGIVTDNSRITALEKEINNINLKMQSQIPSPINSNDVFKYGRANEEIKGFMEEVFALKDNEVSRDVFTLNVREMNEKEDQRFAMRSPVNTVTDSRITAMEKEINDIKLKIKSQAPTTTIQHNLFSYEEQKGYMEKIHEELHQYAQQMAAKCSSAQQERDSLDLQISSLHAEVLQAKITSKGLEKRCMELQSHLDASRNINESLNLELSSVRQHAQKLEDTIQAEANEKKALYVQVENLEREKQNLISQKEMLSGMLKARRQKGRKHSSGKHSARSHDQLETVENKSEELTPELNRKHKDQELCTSNPEAQSLRSSHRRSKRSERSKVLKYEENGSTSIKNTDHQTICVKKHRKEKQEHNGNKRKALKVEKKSSFHSEENLYGTDKHSKISNGSDTGKGQSEIVVACYKYLADLLRKLECLLKSNARLDYEKDAVVKYLVGIIKELKDAEILSQNSREQVEKLLNEHISLKDTCFKRENQDPLKNLARQEQKTESMEKEHDQIMVQLHSKTMKLQKAKEKPTTYAK
ncbi:uncharacterized protein O3C94_000441 [Discoglossus pictus]